MNGISLNVHRLSPAQQRELFEQLPKAKNRTDYEIFYPYWHLQYDSRRDCFFINEFPKQDVSFNEFMDQLKEFRNRFAMKRKRSSVETV